MIATYTKLKSGDWGIRIEGGKPESGSSITVSKRDGSSKIESIDKVLWSDGKVSLCSIAKQVQPEAVRAYSGGQRRGGPTGSRGRSGYCRCGEKLERWHDGYSIGLCHDCV